ncbi:DUF1576 domain-containing protein [Peptostreptococcaceae bacterium AGR-M142]
MILSSKIKEREIHKNEIQKILFIIPLMFFVFGIFIEMVVYKDFNSLLKNLLKILLSETILVTDFLDIGGIGASFINASLIGFLNLYILKKKQMRINGLLIAAFMTVLGFSFFGKNLFNILPIYMGGYLYAKFQRINSRDIILVIMFSTALAPIVSEISYGGLFLYPYSIIIGIFVGILIGFIIVPLSSHMLKFHDGFNLYNIGFTAGILGTVFASILKSFNLNLKANSNLYMEINLYMISFFFIIFIYFIVIGLYINKNALKEYIKIFKYKGRTITDFTHLVGYGLTFFNMGILGVIALTYVIIVGGIVNGPVIAGIFTIVGFGAFGKHIKNCLPIVLGVLLGAYLMGYNISETGIIVSVMFSTTLAPIAGTYGVIPGIIAGFLHMAIVTNIGIIHGGINLYNNGFSGGLVAGFLVPIIDAFKKGD